MDQRQIEKALDCNRTHPKSGLEYSLKAAALFAGVPYIAIIVASRS